MSNITRRELLRNVGVGAVALGAETIISGSASASSGGRGRRRAIRIGHLTDMHVEPELHSAQGFAKALNHVQSLKDKPELIIFGGDHVMDSFEADDARTALQWKLFHNVVASECSLPHESCIGNHDVWGWLKSKAGTTGDEPLFGKKRALDELKLSERYRSFDRAGWHFVVLDSIFPNGEYYRALFDDEQFAWLESDLKANTKSPIMVVSHCPIFSVTPFIDDTVDKDFRYEVNSGNVHGDMNRFRNLVKTYPNVKVAVSGHTHLLDRVDYNGVSYLCNGAVSGAWWRGPNGDGDCPEGYTVMDLYEDGTFEHQYIPYGWVAQA
jgi:hypothetical protein